MPRRARTASLAAIALVFALHAPFGCSKKEASGDGTAPAETSSAADMPAAKDKAAGSTGSVGDGAAAPSPDEKRRGRRGIETGTSDKAVSLFADAPAPPPLKAPAEGAAAAEGPAPVAMPEGARRTSRIALLAHHLKTMRKLKAGIVSEAASVTVYDAGHEREVFDRAALLNGDGRWLSATLVGFVPKPPDASVEGAVGVITAVELGWRIVYLYTADRWRLSEVWRDTR